MNRKFEACDARRLHVLHDVLLLKHQFAFQFCGGAEQACNHDLSLVVCCQLVFELRLAAHFAEVCLIAEPEVPHRQLVEVCLIAELVLEVLHRQLVEVQSPSGAFCP